MASKGTKAIEEALRQLGAVSGGYKPKKFTPIDYSKILKKMELPDMSHIKKNGWDFTDDFNWSTSGKKKSKAKVNIWDVLNGTFGAPGGFITSSTEAQMRANKKYEKSDKTLLDNLKLQWELNAAPLKTLGKAAKDGGKEQWKDWNDGKLSWGDIPGVGALHGIDKGWKRGSDVTTTLGMDKGWKKTTAGIAIDIFSDPLTYLTGGASLATKAGKTAELKKIAELAETVGLNGKKFKNTNAFMDAVTDAATKKFEANPNINKQLAQRVVDKKIAKLTDEIKTARTTAYNANINKWGMSIPFSNKASVSIGDIGKKNLLYRSEAKVTKALVNNFIGKVTKGNSTHADQLAKAVKARYGVNSFDELTKTQFSDLSEQLKPLMKNKKSIPGSKVTDEVKAKDFYKSISDLKSKKYNQMTKAKTKFEHALDKVNPFDARTLNTGDKLVNSMADHIADANSERVGGLAQYKRALNSVEDFIKKSGGTKAEKETLMKEAIYHLEGHAPKAYGKDWIPSDAVKELADKIKPILDDVKAKEVAAGTLTNPKNNYFPHIVRKSEEELKKIREFKDRHGSLNGLDKLSKNNKKRSSFQTMAQRDDYMVKLDKLIRSETDEVAKELLQKQLDDVTDLFDTDIVSAVTRRIREGVRAKSMAAMQGELKKFGMMVSDPKDASEFAGLRKLEPSEAAKLGLEKGVAHYMNDDVLKGMEKIDEMFTPKGMGKVMRTLNATTDIWRSLVTSYKPSHYRNNIIGNIINNMAAGVNPPDYIKAHKLLNKAKKGTLSPSEKKLMESAYKHNVISGGFLTDDHGGFIFDDPMLIEKFSKGVSDNKVIKNVRGIVGEQIDDSSRLANYLNGVNKFGDNELAARQVREYLFNYNEMTNADRKMRMAVPFWNWTKRNVPLQVKLLMEQPKVAMNVERFQQLFNDGQEGQDWQKESGIKIPGTDYYTSLPSPTKDLNVLLNPLSFLSSIAPVPKMVTEIALNKKFFTQKPISYGSDSTQLEDYPEYFAKNFGITGNIYDAITGKKGMTESLVNSVNPIYGVQE